MKKYEKPVVMINEELAEGVYAASGCWSATGAGTQTSVAARNDWRFTISGVHSASEPHKANVYITFAFDQDISDASYSGYTKIEVSGKKAVFQLTNYNNGVNKTENFGGAALNVTTVNAVTSLTLSSVTITDGGAY